MPFKRILCPMDFSNSALAAFETAVEMAQRDSAELLVLHVIEGRPVVSEWFPTHSLGEMTVRMEEKAHQAVNTVDLHGSKNSRARRGHDYSQRRSVR